MTRMGDVRRALAMLNVCTHIGAYLDSLADLGLVSVCSYAQSMSQRYVARRDMYIALTSGINMLVPCLFQGVFDGMLNLPRFGLKAYSRSDTQMRLPKG